MEKEYCQCCGQSISKHKHSLSKNMIRILHKAATCGISNFHLQQHINLTKNEYANFQKLKYWGLVVRSPHLSGYWQITKQGILFIKGETDLPKWVQTFNNKVVDTSKDLVSVHDLGLFLRYKRREEYANDAEPAFERTLF